MPYTMTIHTVGGVPGHFFVELNDGTTSIYKGFAPAPGFHTLSTVTSVPGYLEDDSKRITDPTHLASQPIPITDQGAQNVLDYFDKVDSSPGGYDPYNRDCIDFADGALQAAGTGKDVGAVLTPAQQDQMGAAEVYRNHKYPDNTGLTFPMPPDPDTGDNATPNPFLDSPLAKQFPDYHPPASLDEPIPPAPGGGQSTTGGGGGGGDGSGLSFPMPPKPGADTGAAPDGTSSDASSPAADPAAGPADDDDDGPLDDDEAAAITSNFAPDSMVLNDLDL